MANDHDLSADVETVTFAIASATIIQGQGTIVRLGYIQNTGSDPLILISERGERVAIAPGQKVCILVHKE